MLLRRRILAGDRGFTLVEVMVAVALLLVGVLGTITMVTGANAQTAVTKSREGATNLAREVMDAARGVDYDSLTAGGVVPALQGQPGLADSDTSLGGWQINRRGIVYTIASLPICIVDGQADGYGAHPTQSDPAAPGYCSGQSTGTADSNPDDFRRMDVTITWSVGGRSYSLRNTSLIINPSGGIGPTVKSLCRVSGPTDSTCPATALGVVKTEQSLSFLALTSVADTTTWMIDDGSNPVDVSTSNVGAPTGTAWNFTWNIGNPATEDAYTCGMTVDWTLDGNYIVSAQAVSGIGANGVAGQQKPYTVTIDRRLPYRVCGLSGGYDDMPSAPAGHPTAVDLEWNDNQERDVVGYRVYRVKGDTDANDVLVCDTTDATSFPYSSGNCVCTTKTACLDASPRNSASTVTYRVTALDHDPLTGALRPSPDLDQSTLTVDQSANTPPAFDPGPTTVTYSGGEALISWPPATDSDGIRYYRIYRDGTAYVNRYDLVSAGTTTYTDPDPSPGGNTYYVTAVDNRYDESAPVPAVLQ